MNPQTQEPRGNVGVVTDMTVVESDAPANDETLAEELLRLRLQDAAPAPAPGSHSAPLPPAPADATASGDAPADPRAAGQSYLVNGGGDAKTFRVVELEDGKAVGARIGRVAVRDDNTLVFVDLNQQPPAERNAAEIALLEHRLAEARGEV